MMNLRNVFDDKYIVTECIGKGAFGYVYKALRKCDNKNVAIKIENKTDCIQRLRYEYNIYKCLLKKHNNINKGIPYIYEYIETNDFNMMVMDLLGNSLEDVFNKYNRKFTTHTIMFIAIQTIILIQNLHMSGYIHRDIKPNNFLIGNNGTSRIYLTDFGLSTNYMTPQKTHIPISFNHKFVGTVRYSSINMHMNFRPSRRDDLEALGYMFVYFKNGKLPWQNMKYSSHKTMFEEIYNCKLSTPVEQLCDGLPHCFVEYIEYCRKLRYDQKPNYRYLILLFANEISKYEYINCQIDWLAK